MDFPELKIINKVEKEQREKGIEEVQIQKEKANFYEMILNNYFSGIIMDLHKEISEKIDKLSFYGEWYSLSSIAKHAMKNAVLSLEKEAHEDKMMKQIKSLYEIKEIVLDTPISKIYDVFNSEFLKKHGFEKED